MENVKQSWQNLPEKTRKLIKVLAGGTIVIALAAILALNFLGKNPDYGTLFTGLSQEEAQQVVGLLQDEGIDYRYNNSDGAIRVPEGVVDQTRASLLSKGYPKSGFTYDMYLDNTGLMTTESDKQQISLYDLQNRLGATIRLFDGVRDATVTVVEAQNQRYALGDGSEKDATASVVVTMQDGENLTADKAQAVKSLIAHAVRGMNFTEVSVFDSSTMLEVSGDSSSASSGATDLASLTTLVENNIAANVRRVLEPIYGVGNVAVSVKGTLNMERLIQENTQYSTPEKIDEEDKVGLLQTEDVMNESTNSANQGAGGLVGADANADVPRYTNEDGTTQTTDSYANGSASRVWLYNMLKEQRQIDPGVLEDTSIGVSILTNDMTSVDQNELLRLVANSAGVPVENISDKITVVRVPVQIQEDTDGTTGPGGEGEIEEVSGWKVLIAMLPLPVLIAIIAGVVLLFLLILLLLLRRRRKKKQLILLEGEEGEGAEALPGGEGEEEEEGEEGRARTPLEEEEDEFAKNEEILNLKMQRSLRLKQNISEFVDQNPQIAAKLIQSWLRGEEEGDGRNRKS